MLCAVVGPVRAVWGPVESELTLGCTAAEPLEMNVHLFG